MIEEIKGVATGSSSIILGDDAIAELLTAIHKFDKVFLLVDENTNQYCLPKIGGSQNGFFDFKIIIPSGEANKNLKTVEQIWKILIEENANRKSLIVNLGGGTVTDIGGFAAATFMRGISFINLPTTLLAMIDAAIGGKTGIDFDDFKNYIGAFRLPDMVYIVPRFLESLDERQMRAGFAEMLKHALVAGVELWNAIQSISQVSLDALIPLIPAAVRIKTDIISRDFTERGERQKLNFGHTVGHAIETFLLGKGKSILHGEAVAVGMFVEAYLAKEAHLLPEEDFAAIRDLIKKYYTLPSFETNDLSEIFHLMKYDKKNEKGEIYFSIPNRIGHCLIRQTFTDGQIAESLESCLLKQTGIKKEPNQARTDSRSG